MSKLISREEAEIIREKGYKEWQESLSEYDDYDYDRDVVWSIAVVALISLFFYCVVIIGLVMAVLP